MDYTKKIVYQSNYWYNDGLRRARTRDMSGAIASLRRSLQFNRENIAARNLLGLVYYGIGEVPEALVEWIISKNLRSYNNIADYYINTVQASAKELEVINLAIKKYNQCLAYCQQNGEDLAQRSGIPGLRFCHASRFMVTGAEKADVIEAMLALDEKESQNVESAVPEKKAAVPEKKPVRKFFTFIYMLWVISSF